MKNKLFNTIASASLYGMCLNLSTSAMLNETAASLQAIQVVPGTVANTTVTSVSANDAAIPLQLVSLDQVSVLFMPLIKEAVKAGIEEAERMKTEKAKEKYEAYEASKAAYKKKATEYETTMEKYDSAKGEYYSAKEKYNSANEKHTENNAAYNNVVEAYNNAQDEFNLTTEPNTVTREYYTVVDNIAHSTDLFVEKEIRIKRTQILDKMIQVLNETISVLNETTSTLNSETKTFDEIEAIRKTRSSDVTSSTRDAHLTCLMEEQVRLKGEKIRLIQERTRLMKERTRLTIEHTNLLEEAVLLIKKQTSLTKATTEDNSRKRLRGSLDPDDDVRLFYPLCVPAPTVAYMPPRVVRRAAVPHAVAAVPQEGRPAVASADALNIISSIFGVPAESLRVLFHDPPLPTAPPHGPGAASPHGLGAALPQEGRPAVAPPIPGLFAAPAPAAPPHGPGAALPQEGRPAVASAGFSFGLGRRPAHGRAGIPPSVS